MKISDKLNTILTNINSDLATDLINYKGDIESMDIMGANNLVSYKQGKHSNRSKIGSLVKSIFGNKYNDKQIFMFVEAFKKEHDGLDSLSFDDEDDAFKYVSSTFRKLTTETYPHGFEQEVIPLLELTELKTDSCGNYYKIVPGDNTTMITCHLDTASFKKQKVGYKVGKDSKGQIFAYTDGT